MFEIALHFIISTLFILVAGTFLAKFADRIATVTGWGRLFVGGLLLAAGTSLPELTVDVNAIQENLPDLAVGDLLGSSLLNLLILAFLDFSYPSAFRRTAFSPQNKHHSLSAVLAIFLTTIVGIGISSRLNYQVMGAGIWAWAVLLIYIVGLRLIFKESTSEDISQVIKARGPVLFKKDFLIPLLGFAVCAITIFLASPFLVRSADAISKQSGLGQTFIGTTLIALTTSLPELVSTFVAFRMGKPDLAIGNIFGSNAFNMILTLPLDLAYPQDLLSSVGNAHVVTAFCVVGVMSIAVMGQIYLRKQKEIVFERSSEIIFILILLYLYLLYWLNK